MSSKSAEDKRKPRYGILDGMRGLVLCSMIIYHGCWDLVYIFHMDFSWYQSRGAYVWQQSICWTFIFLSGFCWSLGKKPFKRGMTVFGAGVLVTLVTCLFMPQDRVVFGVLTLIGSCMLLMLPMEKLVKKIPPKTGIFFSFLLFLLTRNINNGYLGFEEIRLARVPEQWYQGLIAAYLGLPFPGFFSTDYFSLIPWLFLFISGYFLYGIFYDHNGMENNLWKKEIPFFSFLGRKSLLIYMLHQPVIYLLLSLIFGFWQ